MWPRSSVRALALDVSENIAPFSVYLWQQRIAHRIFEERGEQILEVDSAERAAEVRALYAAWRAGEFTLTEIPEPERPRASSVLLHFPGVIALVVLAIVFYPATWSLDDGRVGWLLPWLTIVPVDLDRGFLTYAKLTDTLSAGEIWRLITPILVHFSFPHLAFNVALLVEFGRRVEYVRGTIGLVVVVIVIAAVSNATQYVVGDTPLFGGLSGVVYGLFGYVVVRSRLDPMQSAWRVNAAFAVVMVVFLVAMSTGVTESFGLNIANGAHWSGLASGIALAITPGWHSRGR